MSELGEDSLVSREAESFLSGILFLDLLLEIGGGSSLSLGFELLDEGLFSPADGVAEISKFAVRSRVSESLDLKSINDDLSLHSVVRGGDTFEDF